VQARSPANPRNAAADYQTVTTLAQILRSDGAWRAMQFDIPEPACVPFK
jgi:hypothetical protein